MEWFKELVEIIPGAVMYAKIVLVLLQFGETDGFNDKLKEIGASNAYVMSIQVAKIMVKTNGNDEQRSMAESYAQ